MYFDIRVVGRERAAPGRSNMGRTLCKRAREGRREVPRFATDSRERQSRGGENRVCQSRRNGWIGPGWQGGRMSKAY